MTTPHDFEVIVIGAGAAGLLAAIRSAELGKSTLLIEKNRKVGVKILISGGSRCNVTHNTDRKGIIEGFGKNGKFLHSALTQFGPQDVVAMLLAEGVETKVEPNGKIFPGSDKAFDVQQALLRRMQRSGCQLANQQTVTNVQPIDHGFQVTTVDQAFDCQKVIVTTGGLSYPGCGTTGDGYPWMRALGHTVTHTYPALVPLRSEADWVHQLKGIALPAANVSVLENAWLDKTTDIDSRWAMVRKRSLIQRQAPLLFTHFGLSGPAAMDVSKAISSHPEPRSLNCVVDSLPATDIHILAQKLQNAIQANGNRTIGRILSHDLLLDTDIPERLADTFLSLANVDKSRKAAEVSKVDRIRIVQNLKMLTIPVTQTLGYEKAEVTTGGVVLAEVDPKTMQSKICPGLFLAGEILDLDGRIGGFNFQAAFSTGWVAGTNV